MAISINVNYFNSFYAKRLYGRGEVDDAGVVAPGNIPYAYEQGEVACDTCTWYNPILGNTTYDWCIEASRIRCGFNNTSVDFGVKAYIVEDNPNQQLLSNTLIYSGVFNARTGVNNTNQFSVGEEITRGVDPVGGTIQRLYAEDTNLIVFQQRKVNVALIDKDAIFTAEGLGLSTTGKQVIGQITPVAGNWGIGNNPESFATYGYTKYFVDKEQNAVLKMQGTSIQEISVAGMTNFFRNEFTNMSDSGAIVGGYDIYNKNYVLSLQPEGRFEESREYKTLAWDERSAGWTSFFTYLPDQIFSSIGKFYSCKENKLYQHYDSSALRNEFYGSTSPSVIQFVFNPQPNFIKTFKTINYEGSNGWEVTNIVSDQTGETEFPTLSGLYYNYDDEATGDVRELDGANSGIAYDKIWSYDEGLYTENNIEYRAGFDRKQNKYYAVIPNNTVDPMPGEVIWGNQTMGIKGYYTTVTMSTDQTTNLGGAKALFAASSEYINK